MMAVVMPTQQNHDALGTDDRLVRGMGISANEILEHLRRLTHMYYESSEVLLNYSPDSSLFVNPSIFERFVRRSLGDTFNDLERLRTWDVGWNGYDAPKPEHTAIEQGNMLRTLIKNRTCSFLSVRCGHDILFLSRLSTSWGER